MPPPKMNSLPRRHFFLALGASLPAVAVEDLAAQWRRIARATDGSVGAAALDLDSGRLVHMNGDEPFPLWSICKVPIAMNVLALVDQGRLRLDHEIEVLPRDVWAGVSDAAELWPAQPRFPLRQLIEWMVAHSDNTAEETLYRIGGGSAAITARLRDWRIDAIRIDRSERQCVLDRSGVASYPPADQWTDAAIRKLIDSVEPANRFAAARRSLDDPRDTGTPSGTVGLLARLFRGEALSAGSTSFLIDVMKATTTFPARLKGMLPTGTVVAHKTASSDVVNRLAAATNDSGVLFLPDGRRLAISVYVKASTRTGSERDRVIARIARAAFDAAAG